MRKLKDYVEKIGHDYSRIENSLWYLSELARLGAIEIDNYLRGRNHDFSHVKELAEILGKYQLKDTDTALTKPFFPCSPFSRAIRKNSDKDIKQYSELALEMRLLRFELGNVPANSKRLEELRSLLCDFSKELINEQDQYDYLCRLVA